MDLQNIVKEARVRPFVQVIGIRHTDTSQLLLLQSAKKLQDYIDRKNKDPKDRS
jgi:hypothetical protein